MALTFEATVTLGSLPILIKGDTREEFLREYWILAGLQHSFQNGPDSRPDVIPFLETDNAGHTRVGFYDPNQHQKLEFGKRGGEVDRWFIREKGATYDKANYKGWENAPGARPAPPTLAPLPYSREQERATDEQKAHIRMGICKYLGLRDCSSLTQAGVYSFCKEHFGLNLGEAGVLRSDAQIIIAGLERLQQVEG